MKTGIITIHSAYNYGSALQAIASCEAVRYLTEQDAEIIDFQPDDIMAMYSLDIRKNIGSIKDFIKFIITCKSRRLKKQAFDSFWKKNDCLSADCYKDQEDLYRCNQNYDCFIVGSDQVWNPEIVKETFPAFCLDFVDEDKKKISYASSFGVKSIAEKKLAFLNRSLRSFDAISVRESEARNILNQEVRENTVVVCDPVFLLSADQWKKKEKEISLPKEYILVYCVEQDKEFRKKIRELGERLNLPIVDVGTAANPKNYVGLHWDSIGPAEFLYAVSHANYVITNSFHGTAFSVIYKKKFIVKAHSTRGVRMKNLLDKVGMLDRLVQGEESVDLLLQKIQKEVSEKNIKLEQYVKESKQYLKEAIGNEREKNEY